MVLSAEAAKRPSAPRPPRATMESSQQQRTHICTLGDRLHGGMPGMSFHPPTTEGARCGCVPGPSPIPKGCPLLPGPPQGSPLTFALFLPLCKWAKESLETSAPGCLEQRLAPLWVGWEPRLLPWQ